MTAEVTVEVINNYKPGSLKFKAIAMIFKKKITLAAVVLGSLGKIASGGFKSLFKKAAK